ncbi:MAG: hypothetical protein QG629_119 [Patescibacteria group bacterium]|nr:hypothetical protein [Candidatus Saccharibacteria bacterium]MDQ5963037.1 hypothetical protein [Patescibacteria group bacterium]
MRTRNKNYSDQHRIRCYFLLTIITIIGIGVIGVCPLSSSSTNSTRHIDDSQVSNFVSNSSENNEIVSAQPDVKIARTRMPLIKVASLNVLGAGYPQAPIFNRAYDTTDRNRAQQAADKFSTLRMDVVGVQELDSYKAQFGMF